MRVEGGDMFTYRGHLHNPRCPMYLSTMTKDETSEGNFCAKKNPFSDCNFMTKVN